ATSNVRDVTDVTDVSPSEEGRRKKEGLPNFRPLALSPSLSPLLRSDRTSAVPDRPFASPVNAIFCKNTVNLYWKNISSS
ncbi:hypothetical protein, partial [Microcoleus sp. S11D4]